MRLYNTEMYVANSFYTADKFLQEVERMGFRIYDYVRKTTVKLFTGELDEIAYRICENHMFSCTQNIQDYKDKNLTIVFVDDIIDRKEMKIEGDKKMNIKLLDIYYEKESKKLHEKYENKAEKLRMQDLRYSTLKSIEAVVKTNGLEEAVSVYPNSIKLNDYIEQEVRKVYNELGKKETELNMLCGEINAQLEMCETYEQKQEILKRYKVINEKGTIN